MRGICRRVRGASGDRGGGSPQAAREAGRAAYERGDYAAALEAFSEAARLAPRSVGPWLSIARTQMRLGDRAAAYGAVERALELEPDEPNATWLRVRLLEEDGRVDELRDVVLGLCRLHPDDQALNRRGGATLVRAGRRDDAEALAGALLALDPADAVGLAARAVALEARGDREAAALLVGAGVGASGRASGVGPEPAALYHLWSGRPADAWLAIEAGGAPAAAVPTIVEIGLALRRAGQLELARAAFRRALELEPGEPTARRWADTTEGELVVLSGRWRHVPPATRSVEPVSGRVLHLVTKSRPYVQDGYTLRTEYLVAAQGSLGLEPHVATQLGFPWVQGHRVDPAFTEQGGVAHHHLPAPEGGLPARLDDRLSANLDRLVELTELVRPGILHAASDYRNGLMALRLGELCRLPVVYEVRGFWEESWLSRGERDTTSDAYRWRQERETECMQRAAAVVTLSDGMAAEIAARGIDRDRISIVPNGVDVERFVPIGRDPELARRWGVGPGDVTLGYVSTLSAYEGVEYLLQGAQRLIGRGHPVRVVLVGDGEEMGALRRLAGELDIADRVAFCGRVPHEDVLAYYGLIDVFVVPRTDDRVSHLVTPLKPVEAMAAGRALIVSGVDALRSLVREGETGLVFRQEDADDLAAVAEPLVLDAERRASLGAAARAWVVEERSWSRLAARYLDVYRSLGASI